jgi:chromosomal replication initiator protein
MKGQTGVAMAFDPKLTFDTFVVGPANRLAAAAARRAAEAPGGGYNPLFLYSASGLGKSHILTAIAHHALRKNPERVVLYQTLEGYLDALTQALAESGPGSGTDPYAEADVLLLDDVQFLTGQPQAQEMLLRTLDALTARGAQVVLASDRPPAEINGLDARLLSRFSGGLIVDIGLPDYETRVAIMRRKVSDRNATVVDGVIEALGRHPFRNVRELQGALNRLLALQEIEERLVQVDELASALGPRFSPEGRGDAEDGDPAPVAPSPGGRAPAPEPPEPEWLRSFRQVVRAVESAGYSARRLRRHMAPGAAEPDDWRGILAGYRADLDRLREIRAELEALGELSSPETDALLGDPDHLSEAERRLVQARERERGFEPLPPGPVLSATGTRFPSLARRAAERAMAGDHPEYNPLFVHAPDDGLARGFLEACGRTFLAHHPDGRVGLLPFPEFSEELIRALSTGVAGAWRERWSSVDLLLLHQVEHLGGAERAEEEFFHLFETLKRRGARIFLAADRPAAELDGVDDRLRSRFEGGLVVELGGDAGKGEKPAAAGPARDAPSLARSPEGTPGPFDPPFVAGKGGGTRDTPSADGDALAATLEAIQGMGSGGGATGLSVDSADAVVEPPPAASGSDHALASPAGGRNWTPDPERVVWNWPDLADRIVEEE